MSSFSTVSTGPVAYILVRVASGGYIEPHSSITSSVVALPDNYGMPKYRYAFMPLDRFVFAEQP